MADKAVISQPLTVTVEDQYDPREINGGKTMTRFKVSDDSGSMYATVFSKGPAPAALKKGSVVTLSSTPGRGGALGGVAVNVYNNNHGLQISENAKVDSGSAAPATQDDIPAAYSSPASTPAAPAATGRMSQTELAQAILSVYAETRKLAEAAQIQPDHAHDLGLKAVETVPTSWFGEKWIGR